MTADSPTSLSRTMISFVENGRSLPGLESLVTLSRVLNVDPGEVIERVQIDLGPNPDHADRSDEDLREQARALFWAGDYRASLAALDILAERLARDSKMDEQVRRLSRARLEVNRSTVLRRCGALRAAQSSAERAISLATGTPALQAEGYICLAAVLVEKDCLPVAQDCSVRAVTLAREASPRIRGQAHNQQGDVLFACGQFELALEAFERARDEAVRAGDIQHCTKIEGNIGSCCARLGQRKQAESQFERAVAMARGSGDPQAESLWTLELGRLAFQDGAFDLADRLASAALGIAKPRELILTTFRAEWLRHQVVLKKKPAAEDRHRLAYLRRLLSRLTEHGRVTEVREFRTRIAAEQAS